MGGSRGPPIDLPWAKRQASRETRDTYDALFFMCICCFSHDALHTRTTQRYQDMTRKPLDKANLRALVGLAGILLMFSAYGAGTSMAACPNEELRARLSSQALPDCRAYELITPSYEEGAAPHPIALSEDGSHMVFSNLGAFDSVEGDTLGAQIEGSVYTASRTAAGWATVPIEPPLSIYQNALFLYDVSADFTSSLWGLGTHAQPDAVVELYLRTPTGSFVKIGPPTANLEVSNFFDVTYMGASRDLSHVVFAASRWPFDKTVSGETLYEYVGTGQNAPSLVGVTGGRASTALVGTCGVYLGSNGSKYNAVSADGHRIYFTAVGADNNACGGSEPTADELWAREEFEEAPGSELKMRSTAVSSSECDGNAQCAVAPPGDARFEGASRDGSKVFFTSTQELTPGAAEDSEIGDSATTKGCPATSPGTSGCNLYEVEFESNGTHRLITVSGGDAKPQVQGVARISEDGSHVYFVARGNLTGLAANERGESAVEGEYNLYVYQRDAQYPDGHTSFVAKLSAGDEADWSRVDRRPVELSRDGRYLVFTSSSALTGEGVAKGGPRQVYEYDAQAETLVRASIGSGGYNDNGSAPVYDASIVVGPESQVESAADVSSPSMSWTMSPDDGAVFFQSPTALTPGALSDRVDAREHAVPNTYEYREGNIYLLSDGHDESTVSAGVLGLVGSSASGRDVFFATSDPLIQQDGNTGRDIYDASVEGGFLESSPVAGCSGEACQGQLGVPPVIAAPGSTSEPVDMASPSNVTNASKGRLAAKKSKPKKSKKRAARRKRGHGKTRRVVASGGHSGQERVL
jgi:hypothetical protein